MNIIDEDVVDVIFKDSRLIYCREVPTIAHGASEKLGRVLEDKTYPLVNTFSSEVFPQAPSPLYLRKCYVNWQ